MIEITEQLLVDLGRACPKSMTKESFVAKKIKEANEIVDQCDSIKSKILNINNKHNKELADIERELQGIQNLCSHIQTTKKDEYSKKCLICGEVIDCSPGGYDG